MVRVCDRKINDLYFVNCEVNFDTYVGICQLIEFEKELHSYAVFKTLVKFNGDSQASKIRISINQACTLKQFIKVNRNWKSLIFNEIFDN